MTEINNGWTKFIKSNNVRFDLARYIMAYEHTPSSLRNKAITSIAISLWSKKDLLDAISFYDYYLPVIDSFNALPFFSNILTKISHLSIPKCFVKPLQDAVDAIGQQLIKFYLSQLKPGILLENLNVYLENLCINNDGTINRLKTVKALLKNDHVNTLEKYYLACNNCLVDDIPDLLKLLPEDFLDDSSTDESFYLIFYWTFHFRSENERWYDFIRGKSDLGNGDPGYLLKWAIINENHSAVCYIWENRINEPIVENVISLAMYGFIPRSTYISYYFISQLDEKQFKEFCSWKGLSVMNVLQGNSVWRDLLISMAEWLE